MATHYQEALGLVMEYMRKNPAASVNELCRELDRQKMSAPRVLVAKARRTFRKGAPVEVMTQENGGFVGLVRIPVPAEVRLTTLASEQQQQVAQAREEREARRRKREERQQQRQQEREVAWKAERDAALGAELAARWQASGQKAPDLQPVEQSIPEPERPMSEEPTRTERSERAHRAMLRAQKRLMVNELLDAEPGLDPIVIMGRVKERFGEGVDGRYVYETCRIAREIHKLPQLSTVAPHEREGGAGVPLPSMQEEQGFAATPEEDLQWLIEQARDILRAHQLVTLKFEVTETSGDWQFSVRKICTASGTMKF